jgi:hypothetical protein
MANEQKRNFQKYFSTYEFITLDYLSSSVKAIKFFHPWVAFTAGFSDQALIHKCEPKVFHELFFGIVEHLLACGVCYLLLVVPPPHPNNNHLEKWRFYETIRQFYSDAAIKFEQSVFVVYLDGVFFSRRDSSFDIVITDSSGMPSGINVSLFGTAYALSRSGATGFQRTAVSTCLRLIKEAAVRDHILTCANARLESEAMPFDPEGLLFRIDGRLGLEPVSFLIDKGATVCVIDREWSDQLRDQSPASIGFRSLHQTVCLRLAIGMSQSLDRVAVIGFKTGGVVFQFVALVVPDLSERVLLGGNFSVAVKCSHN